MGRCWTDYDLSVYFEDAEGKTVYTGTDARFNPVSINGGEPHFFQLSYTVPDSLPKGNTPSNLPFPMRRATRKSKCRLPETTARKNITSEK